MSLPAALTHHWAADLIGTPWSPERNCWWLVRESFRLRDGLTMPEIGIGDLQAADKVAEIKAAAKAVGFAQVSGPPLDGDVLLCRDLTGKRHVGRIISWRSRIEILHSDGYMTEKGPTGSVIRQPLAEATQLTDLELWRRAE